MGCGSHDFNAVNRWRFPELSDLLRSLNCDLSDVDHAEFCRAKWVWIRKPTSFLEDGLFGYLILALIALVLLRFLKIESSDLAERNAVSPKSRTDPAMDRLRCIST